MNIARADTEMRLRLSDSKPVPRFDQQVQQLSFTFLQPHFRLPFTLVWLSLIVVNVRNCVPSFGQVRFLSCLLRCFAGCSYCSS